LIGRSDIDEDLAPGLELPCPVLLKKTISASVEAELLGEMVERLAWAAEAWSDEMPTIIKRAPVEAARLPLQLSRPGLHRTKLKLTTDPPRSLGLVEIKVVSRSPEHDVAVLSADGFGESAFRALASVPLQP
jgi:hypothetical protein